MTSNFKRIAIEGGEGSGKSTLIQLLKENLDLNDNVFFREPYLESSVAAQFEAWRLGLLELDEIEEVELFAQARKELTHDKLLKERLFGKIAQLLAVWFIKGKCILCQEMKLLVSILKKIQNLNFQILLFC